MSEGDTVGPSETQIEGEAPSDSRAITRIPVRLMVSAKGTSAILGRTRDLSLKGVFIDTPEPFDVGTVIPLLIELTDQEQIELRAEVVRKTETGMGLRFAEMSPAASRSLRRWVVSHTSTEGDKRQIAQLVEESSKIRPIRDPSRIKQLLGEIEASGERVTLVPVEVVVRDHAHLIEVRSDSLLFHTGAASRLSAQTDIHVLLTLAFVSYSFSVTVLRVDGQRITTGLPTLVVFSERRMRDRRPAPAGAVIRWPSSIVGAEGEHEFPLCDVSDYGLSFAVPIGVVLPLGSRLEGAYLLIEGRRIPLERTEVRNLRLVSGSSDEVRVGVSTAVIPLGKQVRSRRRVEGQTPVGRFFERFKSMVSVVFHRNRERLGGHSQVATRVTFRRGNLPIVGLLDRTTSELGRLKAPLVIIVPGFAGRKEQMSYLAGILVDGFQRQNSDLAVLRIDGTNNLGESGRDEKCDRDGMQTLHYTISGVVEDIRAAIAWAKNNPFVEPTQIVLVSVSLASVGVRRYLTMPEASDVSLWVSYMGAPDIVDAVRNVSGNIDLHAYWRRGQKLGVVSMAGMLCDGDRFWRDIADHGAGDIEAAQSEMSRIRSDVVWLRGLYDGYMDPRRVEVVALTPSPGARELVDVDSGHLPRTGAEAITHFLGVTERVWSSVTERPFQPFTPSLGRLEVRSQGEWQRVRREALSDPTSFWRDYLLDGDGPGFDILEYSPEYAEFMALTATRTVEGLPYGAHVLELGAGTGNVSRRMLEAGVRLTALDLVPEALVVLRRKCAAFGDRLATGEVDLEGSTWTAVRRFLEGDIRSLGHLSERIPGFSRKIADELATDEGDELLALVRGFELDLASYCRQRRLSSQAAQALGDLWLLARLVTGRESITATTRNGKKAVEGLRFFPRNVLEGPRGLALPNESVDSVVLSLVVSYLQRPEDVLAEARRVLKPGGRLVVTSLQRDAETSRLYLGIVMRLQQMPADLLPGEGDPETIRASLIAAARRFVDHGASLFRMEEEGLFRFYEAEDLARLVSLRGFVDVRVETSLGHPPQALVVTCRRP